MSSDRAASHLPTRRHVSHSMHHVAHGTPTSGAASCCFCFCHRVAASPDLHPQCNGRPNNMRQCHAWRRVGQARRWNEHIALERSLPWNSTSPQLELEWIATGDRDGNRTGDRSDHRRASSQFTATGVEENESSLVTCYATRSVGSRCVARSSHLAVECQF